MRLTNLANRQLRQNRTGVYLHWMLPWMYRHGTSNPNASQAAPLYKSCPDRWLVIRRIHPGSFSPSSAADEGLGLWTGWVVESNRIRDLDEFDATTDIEVECAPYILAGDNIDPTNAQGEVFIGKKTDVREWREGPGDFVPLSVLNSGNPLFSDYTPHNTNVFSIIDDMSYTPADEPLKYLTAATASYYVIGWHADDSNDPFNASTSTGTLAELLSQLRLDVDASEQTAFSSILNATAKARTLCHGAMYSVKYTAEGDKSVTVPAENSASKILNPNQPPIAIGTSVMDALLTYAKASNSSGSYFATVAEQIVALEPLILAREDEANVAEEVRAIRTMLDFEPSPVTGERWFFSGSKKTDLEIRTNSQATTPKFVPDDLSLARLNSLNETQRLLDSTRREMQTYRWELFADWWKYSSDITLKTSPKEKQIRRLVQDHKTALEKLGRIEQLCRRKIDEDLLPHLQDPVTKHRIVEKGSADSFWSPKDPTILIPGLESPWPNDYLNPLKVRFGSGLSREAKVAFPPGQEWEKLDAFFQDYVEKALSWQSRVSRSLLFEFFHLHPKENTTDSWTEHIEGILPTYHDHPNSSKVIVVGRDPTAGSRDFWNMTQAWFPLFVEFETRYYHIPWDKWVLQEIRDISKPLSPTQLCYGLDDIGQKYQESVMNNRALILPQPGLSLRRNLEQIFSSVNVNDLPEEFQDTTTRESFLAKVEQIDYMSTSLSGLSDHLATKLNGTHVKPSFKKTTGEITPIPEAAEIASKAGYTTEIIQWMEDETHKVPFADHVSFPNADSVALKPVIHGKFALTKMHIIDKFGQTISLSDPRPTQSLTPVIPAFSEMFQLQDRDPIKTQFGYFQPTINQDARVNASFMIRDKSKEEGFRAINEWESPIWGWLVVNYAQHGLQIFLPDGRFYREVRLGGPTGATESIKWHPFEPPKTNIDMAGEYPQLERLIQELKSEAYLRNLVRLINRSLDDIPHTPNEYAEFLNSIVGRPLALVNAAYSVELAQPPAKNHSTRSLTKPNPELLDYEIPMRFGDKDRSYDGMVAYFAPDQDGILASNPKNLYSHFARTDSVGMTQISPENYPRFKPYFLSATQDGLTPDMYTRQQHQKLKMFGFLLDPFTKLHAYSVMLPCSTLELPQNAIQTAMRGMTAFFSIGPLIITEPKLQTMYQMERNLVADYDLNAVKPALVILPTKSTVSDDDSKPKTEKFKGVALPMMKSEDWNWLQPYAVPSNMEHPSSDDPERTDILPSGPGKETHWNSFDVVDLDNKPRFEQGPYTAVEGYLQLKKAIVPDNI
jgi:hypothetical protein